MAEITPTGFVAKTEQEYFDEERQLYLDIDPQWNLDPSTPDGLKLASDAETFTELDEAIQLAYNSKDPNKARGVDLDTICALTGTFRSLGTPSNVSVRLSGVPNTVVLAGKRIESTVDGTQWALDSNVTIGVGGTVDTTATAIVNGATQADIGTITKIVDSVGGWQSVTNIAVATLGTDVQSNDDLRLERALSVGRPGNNQVDSMLGELFAVDGLRRVKVYENDTGSDAVDPVNNPYGLDAHSIAIVADGGTDEDVALAIYVKKNPGCALYAASTPIVVEVTSPIFPQNKKNITFSRPEYVDITVVVEVTNDGTLPTTSIEDEIKQAILNYASGDLVAAECGFNVQGFDIGEDVPYSRLYTPINQVIGKYGNSFISNLTINGGTSNITIDFNQLSRWVESNIGVSIVV